MDNGELRSIYEEDQADRRAGLPAERLDQRDEARRERVSALLECGIPFSATDLFRAAVIFLHSLDPRDIVRSHELALRSHATDPNPAALSLAAIAKDRELTYLGKLQRFGTSWFVYDDGRRHMFPVDPDTTDEERARWNLPPLAVLVRAFEAAGRTSE